MPAVLGWVLGGNISAFKDADRASHCRVGDKPKAFDEKVHHADWLSVQKLTLA